MHQNTHFSALSSAILLLAKAGRVSSMFYLVPPLVVVEALFLFGKPWAGFQLSACCSE